MPGNVQHDACAKSNGSKLYNSLADFDHLVSRRSLQQLGNDSNSAHVEERTSRER